jgi:HAD superfamily hydrolase (TIGR01509 family)
MLTGILFDLDGTLANTDPIHFAVWQDILTYYKIEIDGAFYRQRILGKTNAEIIKDILPELSLEAAWQLATEKEQRYRQLSGTLQPMPGLPKIIELTESAALKKAVVTNAPKENATHMLDTLRLTYVFPTVILAEDAPPGKPDPAPYLLALERLAIDSSEAIAFEDSTTGIQAARGAGIYTIGITSTHSAKHLRQAGANMAIKDFNSQRLWELLDKKMSCL